MSAPTSGKFPALPLLRKSSFRRWVSYAVSAAKSSTPTTVISQSSPLLRRNMFTSDARITPMRAKSPNRPTALEIALRGHSEHRQAREGAGRHEERRGDRGRRVDEKERREGDARQPRVGEEHEGRRSGAHPRRHGAEREDQPDLREEEPVEQDPVAQERLHQLGGVRDAQRDDPRRRQAERHPSVRHPESVADAVSRGGKRASARVFHGRRLSASPRGGRGIRADFASSSGAARPPWAGGGHLVLS